MRSRHIAREGFGPTALALLTTALLTAAPVRGQILDAGSAPPTAAEGQADPRTEQIRALIAGTLDPAVEPRTLFDVTLSDERVVAVERARLELLLQRLEVAASPQPPLAARAEGAPMRPVDGAAADLADADGAALRRRVALDRARLEFYSLPREKRDALLAEHAAREAELARAENEEQRRARAAEAELARTLATAQSARDEAERLVAQELARLIQTERDVEALRETFRSERSALAARSVGLLAWQQRVRAAISSGASAADETYARLREALGAVHAELAAALDGSESRLPKLGADALRVLQAEVSIEQVRARRKRIEDALGMARREEQALHDERAATLLGELKVLNRERLRLLPYLSHGLREAITGFTQVGFEHARLEADHLLLVLRYHRRVAAGWLASLRARDEVAGPSIWHVSAVVVPWLLATIAFVWWRRRSPALLAVGEARIAELERAERRPQPSPLRRGLRVFRDVHRSLEWLAFYGVMVWLLPAGARELMEVQLLVVVLGWSFAAAFVVNGINALAGAARSTAGQRANAAGALRLRSLRLVGRVAVALFLILLLTSRLVGEGTVYHWVASMRWLAAVVVFLILVRWWRQTVFERIERGRRKSRMQAWVLANRSGWKSFFAAMIGAVQLFAVGSYKVLRHWLTGFDLARRAHAYLFKREIDRLASGKSTSGAAPLGTEAFAALSPERTGGLWVACPADKLLQSLRAQLSREQGGIVALIGGRGLGKSTLLSALAAHAPAALRIDCGDADPVTRVREACTARNQQSAGALELVLLDDVQCLVKPTRSGLRAFDEVLALARACGGSTLWVFAIDSVVWPFLRRARDGRPLFDEVHVMEPWTDEQIGELLSRRSAEAQVVPMFEDLLDRLPASADEIDRQEALSAKRAGYFRMVWDYARGNPAMALEVWRSSLDPDEDGRVHVRPLGAPNASELEALPDPALFILRAVLQMTPASVSDVAQVTRLSEAQVENALRFGEAHGYVVREGGKVRVAWRWLRSVLLLLERRRLLVNP